MSEGLCDSPSHVKVTGIAPPDSISGLESVNVDAEVGREDSATTALLLVPADLEEEEHPAKRIRANTVSVRSG